MAAVTYYMLCVTVDDVIVAFDTVDNYGTIENLEVRSASFSTNPADSPDVLAAAPEKRGTFVAPSTYTAPGPERVRLHAEWSGDGTQVGNIYEMIADGVNAAVLTVRKWNEDDDVAMTDAGDNDDIWVVCSNIGLDEGKKSLVNGVITFTFTPPASSLGLTSVCVASAGSGIESGHAAIGLTSS